ncbi:adenylate/guanylate cyclase domain-containing protein [Nostocoides sp. F2B08]|uniref:adenylate/guanylate cyclase domain-containing protein n=1 Tax=Nostocoides sp. F2B08 TaxID=2653936 RepID=UPI001262C8AC|nr:adenylate/guanylate cyclase domain-containing protein [Tetrasphaera sp. F2B08]KAB7741445.1 adenylate/guanylate cyclase domain-containing protein [Tetrasphaera sp. F2B08]
MSLHRDLAGSGERRGLRSLIADVVDRLSDLGARAGDSRDARLRSGTLILGSVLIAVLSVVWVLTYAAYGYPRSAAIPATYQVVTVVGLVVLARTRRFDVFRRTQLLVMLILPALLQASLGGFVASSGVLLWALFVPLAALALYGVRGAGVWLAAFLAEVAILAVLDPLLSQQPAALPRAVVNAFFVLNIMGVTVSAYLMLAYFVEQRERMHRALEVEQDRSERLLLNVLPSAVADRLKDSTGVIAERHENVSVLFADLVDFTPHTSTVPPEELVALLDRIFTTFDQRTEALGLEKIKTIGDAYMVAGGVPEPRPGHLEAMARLALAMREDIIAIADSTGQTWLGLRIGIDAGPVVAGVIGRRKFIYDLWGDTVNTASRMQSSGQPGQIQVTGRVESALADAFVLRPRGTVDLKGKGPTEVFVLDGLRPPKPDAAINETR